MFDAVSSLESEFLKKNFSAYYKNHFIDSVPEAPLREFGFGVFKRKIANRNIAFSSVAEMNQFLQNSAPLFFSYSNSYYRFPERTPTVAKEWLKSDLIYEFDADELGIEVPLINGVQWFSSEHLNEAKRQVFRLIDFLERDFGFNFSGKAGFHVHLRSKNIHSLNKKSRIELVDYLTAHGFDFANMGFDFDSLLCPVPKGLLGERLVGGVKKLLEGDAKVLSKISGLQQKKILNLLSVREKLFDSISKGRLLSLGSKRDAEFWRSLFEYVLLKERVPIDRQTSIDLNKIIRVPQTLHGDTGLLAKIVPLDALKSFEPLKDTVVFDSTPTKVQVIKSPKFSLGDSSFGEMENETVVLPLFAAIYLIGKGAAFLPK
ncbi:MAG: hypothetical protein NTY48_06890 [Candidatus Diapherotrites archaeon]|nr:hypothetical protein [Candidatus Diapherotrites archaeon]